MYFFQRFLWKSRRDSSAFELFHLQFYYSILHGEYVCRNFLVFILFFRKKKSNTNMSHVR